MYQARSRVVITLITVFTLVLGGISFAFAGTENRIIPMPRGGLFSESFSGDQNFVSNDFRTTEKESVRVYFENRGDTPVNVRLQRLSFFGKRVDVSLVDSDDTFFTVKPGEKVYKNFEGGKNKDYRIEIDCPSGAGVSGYVTSRQVG